MRQAGGNPSDRRPAATRHLGWSWLHRWSSLVCTLFLLLLCVTGLPLLFHHEIDHLLGNAVEAPALPADAPRAGLDAVLASAQALHPGLQTQFVFREEGEPDLWFVSLARTMTATENQRVVVVDARTARVLGQPQTESGFIHVMRKLHLDLFAGLPGTLFLGVMGLLFTVAIVSGLVLYPPFTRKLAFGEIRLARSPRVRWLDVHNLVGITTLVWALVVGLTGVVNTLTLPALGYWQANDLPAFVANHRAAIGADGAATTPARLGSLQQAVAAAEAHEPGMAMRFVSFPGGIVSTARHYAVFMHGDSPLTSRLLMPVLVDAETVEVTASAPLPWYLQVLMVSQPLHFGDYGGLPLRILWALLDLATIVVLVSGLVLWWRRPATTVGRRAREVGR